MSRSKKLLIVILIGVWVAQALACAPKSVKRENGNPAEKTLEAIYAEETLNTQIAESETKDEGAKGAPTQAPQQNKKSPLLKPGDPPEAERRLEDSDSSIREYENRAISGDTFLDNLYERPFTSVEMIYQPDLDINTVDFSYDDDFFYFVITLNGMNEEKWSLTGLYGIEFDRTLTGRGDLIVLTENPTKEWSIKNVVVFTDMNGDVGGPTPIVADEGFTGSGYDKRLEIKGKKVALSRISPEDNQAIQFAVSHALLENPDEFLWGAWADNGLRKVALFDYNDTMGPSEAGSPYIDSEDYPIKALHDVDNTCRLPYGFEQTEATYPGMCITIIPEDDYGPACYCNDLCANGVDCCGDWICP